MAPSSSSTIRKGIILAGGAGKRLSPITLAISKQLIPVYDKPMIYYPITTLMLCGIRDILIITTPESKSLFKNLLGDGEKWGISLSYLVQNRPDGIVQALLIGEDFLANAPLALALGDNLFHGNGLVSILKNANNHINQNTVFGYPVNDPERYAVVGFDMSGSIKSIEEKPTSPQSPFAITGLYFYDNSAVQRAKKLDFSSRGELEITSLNKHYLNDGLLKVELMGRGIAWFDTGTFDSLQNASSYIRMLECRQGLKVGCPEEVAWRKGWIDDKQLAKLAKTLLVSGYGEYLMKLLERPKVENDLFYKFD
tara:strand:- start:81 stop:1010 length:930 start_codon:yes stop_codon:yes gene_type:complete